MVRHYSTLLDQRSADYQNKVCVQYQDQDYLKAECIDGRQLGFTGKQAIHPLQVPIIQSTFVPTAEGELMFQPVY